MRTKVFLAISLLACAITTSCKKDKTLDSSPPKPNTISVNGVDYPTVSIGSQTWTAANYSGPGGVALAPGNQKTEYGRFYAQQEAQAITLPAGWRLPTVGDFKKLCLAQGFSLPETGDFSDGPLLEKLMSGSGWVHGSGNNASGLALVPSGFTYYQLDVSQGEGCWLWTANTNGRLQTYFAINRTGTLFRARLRSIANVQWLALRFVKDN